MRTWIRAILVTKAQTRGVREARSVPFASLALGRDAPAVEPERFRGPQDGFPGHWRAYPGNWGAAPGVVLLDRETLEVALRAIAALPPPSRR